MTKKIIVTLLTIIFLICIVGCNNADNSNSKSNKKQSLKEDSIQIEDIDWSVDERVIDGDKCLSFNYTNNTAYTIVDVELKFIQKEGNTVEQIKKVFDDYTSFSNMSDEMISDIYILGYNEKIAESGETVENSHCKINNSWRSQKIQQYEFLEPSELKVEYIGSDNKIHYIYYDYKTETYTKSDDVRELYEWKDTELSKLLPKPKFKFVSSKGDDNSFEFEIKGVDLEQFNSYISDCKNGDFSEEVDKTEDTYNAKTKEGYTLNIEYSSIKEKISGSIK